ncbi:MAG: hypothetical protein U0359_30295 [Byssovorax sp.]
MAAQVVGEAAHRVVEPFPKQVPTAFAFSSDSRTPALGTDDGLVRLFSVPEGELIATADLNPRADAPLSLAFGPDVLWIGMARGVLFRVRLAGTWSPGWARLFRAHTSSCRRSPGPR